MERTLWTKEQVKLAFHLYCQLPFGKLHRGNPEIIKLAKLIGRTPSSLALRLVNMSSLDPAITANGRVGMKNASKLDREVWDEFHADWEALADECEQLRLKLEESAPPAPVISIPDEIIDDEVLPDDFTGETRQILIQQRIKQSFFRRAVLVSYQGRCCMSGLSEPRLLIASHIVPWSKDKANRLNPSNGLCLSAIHDKAFDLGFLTLDDEYRVVLSEKLQSSSDDFVVQTFHAIAGQTIEMPCRFMPDTAFIQRHREEVFLG